MEFKDRLKMLRKERRLTQVKLGEMLNYGYTAIANYESTRNEPSFDDLIKLADLLDVTTDELLGVPLKKKEQTLLSQFKKLSAEVNSITRRWQLLVPPVPWRQAWPQSVRFRFGQR